MKQFINCNILTNNGWLKKTSFCLDNGVFKNIGTSVECKENIDLNDAYVVPGIIDIHGDSFERCMAPRPGVHIPLHSAIYENDNYLLSCGITTFYYSITDSFEEGLRSRENARHMINFITSHALRCNSKIHIRHEVANTKNHEELLHWMQEGKIDLLSINDHLPKLDDKKNLQRYKNGIKRRMVMGEEEIEKFVDSLQEERVIGEAQIQEIVCAAHEHEIPLASHDDDTEEKVNQSLQRKIRIAEFPMNFESAYMHKQNDIFTLFGSPNLIRGGSHVGALSAHDAAKNGVLDIFCSDYHYPSLFLAPFKLVSLGIDSFENAWKKVSYNPARAVKIDDKKGEIANGKDGDFLVLDSLIGELNTIKSVYINGRCQLAY